jgi:hypothetical protein
MGDRAAGDDGHAASAAVLPPTFEEGLKPALRAICEAVKSPDLGDLAPQGGLEGVHGGPFVVIPAVNHAHSRPGRCTDTPRDSAPCALGIGRGALGHSRRDVLPPSSRVRCLMRRPICRRHCTAYIPAQRDQARGLSYKQKSNWPVPTSDSPYKADIRQFGWIVRYVPKPEVRPSAAPISSARSQFCHSQAERSLPHHATVRPARPPTPPRAKPAPMPALSTARNAASA